MTKPVAAVATLRLVQDELIGLDDPIAAWMPELAEPRVLSRPDAALSDSEPAQTPITVRHLLTNQSGFGVMTTDSPLKQAMVAAGVEAGAAPVALGTQDWLNALSALPLAFEPGRGWRYHHSFGLLGILLGRLGRGSTQRVLADTVFTPAGMADTGFSVPPAQAHRLIAAFRHRGEGFEESEPRERASTAPLRHSMSATPNWSRHCGIITRSSERCLMVDCSAPNSGTSCAATRSPLAQRRLRASTRASGRAQAGGLGSRS
ncbi:beta-lactamase family protein [Nesterenkonia pannonica]|uniref:serine hydrolase domain-containing protein n=1 Tax=Nesterenkonia pannonica TaxID=1548602 RepID=UPI0021646FAC|nr:serine hydrolase domain-containing protein [Nesterenkonia pannonica]